MEYLARGSVHFLKECSICSHHDISCGFRLPASICHKASAIAPRLGRWWKQGTISWVDQPQLLYLGRSEKCLVAMSKPNLPNLARMAEMVKMRLSRRWGRETLKDILVNSRCKHVTMSRVSMSCLVAEVATRSEFQTKRTPVHLPTGASLVGVPINREPWLQICEDHWRCHDVGTQHKIQNTKHKTQDTRHEQHCNVAFTIHHQLTSFWFEVLKHSFCVGLQASGILGVPMFPR